MATGNEHFYAQVADEIETDQLYEDTWTKALEQNGFDENKARASYVGMRVEQLKAEVRMRAVEAEREENRKRLEKIKQVGQVVLIVLAGTALLVAFLLAVY
jgi:hypothetical protein